MDDCIRPSQAAKRRSIHGDNELSSDGPCEAVSEGLDTDTELPTLTDNESEIDDEPHRSSKNQKRKNMQSWSTEPLRRSSRRTERPKKAYNMKFHPQDDILQKLSDEESTVQTSSKKKRKLHSILPTIEIDSSEELSDSIEIENPENPVNQDLASSDGAVHYEPLSPIEQSSPAAKMGKPTWTPHEIYEWNWAHSRKLRFFSLSTNLFARA